MIDSVGNRVLMNVFRSKGEELTVKITQWGATLFVVLTNYCSEDQRRKNLMGGLCSRHGGDTCIRSSGWKRRRIVVTLKVQMCVFVCEDEVGHK
jgi:hypothetical protein